MLGKRTQMLVCSPCTVATRSWGHRSTHAGGGSFLAESSGERTPKVTCAWANTHQACREAPVPFSQVTLSTVLTENHLGEIAGCRVVGQASAGTELQVSRGGRKLRCTAQPLPPLHPGIRTHARTREGWGLLFAPLWLCPTDSNHLSVLNTL